MKKKFFVFFALLVIAGSMNTFAQNYLDFTLVNKTGVDIYEIYVAPISDSKSWGPELLGKEPLLNGESIEITFDPGDFEDCKWDLKIKDTEGTSLTWYDIDLCEYWQITIKYNFDTQKGTAVFE